MSFAAETFPTMFAEESFVKNRREVTTPGEKEASSIQHDYNKAAKVGTVLRS